ncbi:MAG: ABC transporter substrate-binding protein [Chitinispirillaceae bacterium]|nr:ABC transporter substrate-binding protein [Chitinispirillaceae bacterium]
MNTMCNRIIPILSVIALLGGCMRNTPEQGGIPGRIVSCAPNVTETLFALGLGNKVVGVTSYCHFPPLADSIEEIGGYTDANLEKILALKPDIVVLQHEHAKQRSFLKRYGVPVLTVNFGTVRDICSSIVVIGKRCGAQQKADSLAGNIISMLNIDPGVTKRPKVLVCVGRESPGNGVVHSVYAAGARTFYSSLIEAAGGANACTDTLPHYPKLSREGIITIGPDIIIDVAPAMGEFACSTLIADWQSATMIPAVSNKRVYCLAEDYATIPGPRVVLLLEDIKRIIADEKS